MEIKNCLISDVEEILNYINITYKKDIFLRKIFIVIVDRVKDRCAKRSWRYPAGESPAQVNLGLHCLCTR